MKDLIIKILFGSFSFVFTFFVFVNSYELLFNKDVPLGFSIEKMSIQDPINREIDDFAINSNSLKLNNSTDLGELDLINFRNLNLQLKLEEARKVDGAWYQRPSIAQYIGLNKDSDNHTVDFLIYVKSSWRAIPYADALEEGQRITIVSKKGLEANFVVENKKLLNKNETYIVGKSENRQVVLLVEDSTQSKYYGYSLVTSN